MIVSCVNKFQLTDFYSDTLKMHGVQSSSAVVLEKQLSQNDVSDMGVATSSSAL